MRISLQVLGLVICRPLSRCFHRNVSNGTFLINQAEDALLSSPSRTLLLPTKHLVPDVWTFVMRLNDLLLDYSLPGLNAWLFLTSWYEVEYFEVKVLLINYTEKKKIPLQWTILNEFVTFHFLVLDVMIYYANNKVYTRYAVSLCFIMSCTDCAGFHPP